MVEWSNSHFAIRTYTSILTCSRGCLQILTFSGEAFLCWASNRLCKIFLIFNVSKLQLWLCTHTQLPLKYDWYDLDMTLNSKSCCMYPIWGLACNRGRAHTLISQHFVRLWGLQFVVWAKMVLELGSGNLAMFNQWLLQERHFSVVHIRLCCMLGAVSIRKTVLPGMAIPMLKIRRPNGRLIFNMEIAIRR